MTVAILALQGAFIEHAAMLDRLGAAHVEIRQRRDLDRPFDGLILPGGESTTMRKLLHDLGLFQPLREQIESGLPVFGTCAGLILLAQSVEGGAVCFGTMDIAVRRNAEMRGVGRIPMTFIRAPYIAAAGPKAEVLAEVDGHIVAARQDKQLVTAFHPELNDDLSVHQYFLNLL